MGVPAEPAGDMMPADMGVPGDDILCSRLRDMQTSSLCCVHTLMVPASRCP